MPHTLHPVPARYCIVGYRALFAVAVATSLLLSPPPAVHADSVEITAQTTGCGGETGYAAFPSNRLVKIEDGWCSDPTDPARMLQQVFLKSQSGPGQYDLIWVTRDEAESILAQVKAIRDAKLENLSKPDVVIERETIVREPDRPPASNAPVTRGQSAPPTIKVLDPPIGNIRSAINFMTAAETDSRLIVGKAEAPAGLLSVTLNGRPIDFDEQGLFRAEVLLRSGGTPVSIVAVDRSGESSTAEFRFFSEPPPVADTAVTDGDFFGNYHALIIANDQYQHLDDLTTPINDAEAVATILSNRYGFRVTKLYDASRYQIVTALNGLRRDLTDNDNLLIYYAGHGEFDRINHRGHWLPVDAERDSTANWLSTSVITDTLNAMSSKHVLVVADSCYSGSLTRSTLTELDPGMTPEARKDWLRTIAATRTRFVLTSGGIRPILDDSGNGHSVFANAFIDVLGNSRGVLEGSRLYQDVRDRVIVRAEELEVEQTPQFSALKGTRHEFGEFLFVARD
jgi:hypothetical protein